MMLIESAMRKESNRSAYQRCCCLATTGNTSFSNWVPVGLSRWGRGLEGGVAVSGLVQTQETQHRYCIVLMSRCMPFLPAISAEWFCLAQPLTPQPKYLSWHLDKNSTAVPELVAFLESKTPKLC